MHGIRIDPLKNHLYNLLKIKILMRIHAIGKNFLKNYLIAYVCLYSNNYYLFAYNLFIPNDQLIFYKNTDTRVFLINTQYFFTTCVLRKKKRQ